MNKLFIFILGILLMFSCNSKLGKAGDNNLKEGAKDQSTETVKIAQNTNVNNYACYLNIFNKLYPDKAIATSLNDKHEVEDIITIDKGLNISLPVGNSFEVTGKTLYTLNKNVGHLHLAIEFGVTGIEKKAELASIDLDGNIDNAVLRAKSGLNNIELICNIVK